MLTINHICGRAMFGAVVISAVLAGSASAQPLALFDNGRQPTIFDQVIRDQTATADTQDEAQLPARFRRQVVDYPVREAPGTIVIDTPHTYLYYLLGNGRAIRYGIGVGRDGFTWSGVQNVARKTEWPDWTPPVDMLQRQPYLPRFMAGGPGNPLGARAMYLGETQYRIHGTNQPSTIGGHVSSGCIRMTNDDVIDLYDRVQVGAKVVVLPDDQKHMTLTPVASSRQPVAVSTRARSSGLY
ncbi:MAG TPA: L,D-transpeptidase [Xanthobacteraceae bacterium]|nr:L,D-transpeptidase [Xanthobacteraceae bacterium]